MKRIFRIVVISLICVGSLVMVYRGSFTGNKVVFPTNFLASFFSPWGNTKFPGWLQGIPAKPIGTDQIRFFYPVRKVVNDQLQKSQWPLWNPHIFGGVPLLANYQSAIFSPFSFLSLLFSLPSSWTITVFLAPILGTLFTFLFIRALGGSFKGSLLGGYAFGFSGFILSWSSEALAVPQTAIWLPLLLFGAERFLKTGKITFWLTLLFGVAFSFLSGYFQITFYSLALVAIFIIYRSFLSDEPVRDRFLKLVVTFSAVVMGVALSSIQLLPSAEAFFLSSRPTTQINLVHQTYLIPITHLLRLIAPDINGNTVSYNYFAPGSYNETALYIGLVPLLFALFAIFIKRASVTTFFMTGAIVSFALTSNNLITRYILNLPLPLIPTFQPSRILILTTLCLAVLSGIGFTNWVKTGNKKIFKLLGFLFFMLIIGAGYYYLAYPYPQGLTAIRNTVLPMALLLITGAALKFLPARFSPIFLIGLTMFSQIYFLNKYSMQGEKEFLYPKLSVFSFLESQEKDFSRHLTFGESIKENSSMMFGLYSPEGFDPIYPARYGQLVKAATFDGKLDRSAISRIEVTLSELGNHEIINDNFRRLKLISLLGVKTVLYYPKRDVPRPYEDIFDADGFEKISSFSGWTALRNKAVLPRVFLVNNVVTASSQQDALDKIFDPATDLGRTAVIEGAFPYSLNSRESSGTAHLLRYLANEVNIKTESLTPRLLFISDSFYPGWNAYVDGVKTKVFLTNYNFRGVYISEGNHEVIFKYEPTSFYWGRAISVGSLLIVVGILAFFLAARVWRVMRLNIF